MNRPLRGCFLVDLKSHLCLCRQSFKQHRGTTCIRAWFLGISSTKLRSTASIAVESLGSALSFKTQDSSHDGYG